MIRVRKALRGFFIIAAATLMVGAATLAKPVLAAEFTMKIGFVTFKDVQHQWANWMKEEIERRSGGRIEVKLFPRGQLGSVRSQIEGLQTGTVEAFVAPTDFFAGIDSRFGVFSIPVLFKNKAHAAKVIADPELNAEIRRLGGGKGMKVVSIFTHSTAHYLGKKPIRRLSDFNGLKMRINATPAEREKMKRIGATGIPMGLGQVVASMQRGAIDGTMSGTVVYVIFKFINVGKVLTITNDTMIISAGVVSQAFLNRLPAGLREIVIDVGSSLQNRSTEFSHKSEKEMIAKWRQLGGSLVNLPPGDLSKMKKMLASVGEDVTKDNPVLHAFFKKMKAVGDRY